MTINKKLLEGQKFNKLTVIKLDHIEDRVYNCNRSKSGKRVLHLEYYLCKCDCGKETVVEKSHLRKNVDATISCGCVGSKHNMSHKNRIYDIWAGIRQRCLNVKENHPDYKNYKGRGITMCADWKNDFKAFYNWAIKSGYKDNLTIDRIDNNGNYGPNNCRWVDRKIQNRNKRNLKTVYYKGKKFIIPELAELLGLKYHTVYMRYRRRGCI